MTIVVAILKPRPPVRKFYCCACHRYIAETTAREGTIRAKCEACKVWRLIDIRTSVIR